MGCKSIRY